MKLKIKIFDSLYITPKIGLIVFIIVIIFMSALIYINTQYVFITWNQCEESQKFKELEFYGIVSDKVFDKEYEIEQYLMILDSNSNIMKLSLEYEILKLKKTGNSITWELISIGDSIKKKSNTYKVNYKNSKSINWDTREIAFPDCTMLP